MRGVVAAGLACLAVASAASARDAGGRLLFWSGRAGFPGVWSMQADGGGARLLTRFPENAKRGSLSPDGRMLLFDGAGPGVAPMTNFDVQVMRADGTGRRRLTTGPHREIDARWSPDGRTISFTRMLDTSGRVTSIWLMNADGTHKRRVASGGEARWSPNGRELLFSRFDARDRLNLFVLNLATRRVVQLTKSPQYDEPGDWSPDGSAIVFSREGANADVYRVRPDGTGLRRLTRGPADDYACCFAPDGRSIAFTSNRSGHQQVWTMRADGTHLRNASRSVSDDEATQWHP